jgi:hypothetical protein
MLDHFPDAGKMVAFLRNNCYRGPVFYDIVNLFDFVIGDGDATKSRRGVRDIFIRSF